MHTPSTDPSNNADPIDSDGAAGRPEPERAAQPPPPPQQPAQTQQPEVEQPARTEQRPPERPGRPSRRWFVAGTVAVVAAGGAGVAVGLAAGAGESKQPTPPPAALRSALADERTLILGVEAALRTRPGARRRALLGELLRNHRAHAAALTTALAEFEVGPSIPAASTSAVSTSAAATSAASTSAASGPAATSRSALRSAERRAAGRAATRAADLRGPAAAVLASIAACEATHAELLA